LAPNSGGDESQFADVEFAGNADGSGGIVAASARPGSDGFGQGQFSRTAPGRALRRAGDHFPAVRGFEEAPGGQVKVVKPNLLFRKMKLRDGDILVEVNGTQMHSLENLGNELWTWPGPRSFDFIVSRQGKRLRFVTKIEALVKDPEIVAWVEAARAQEEAREKTSPRRK
jgi:hypothetical protein